MVDGICTLANDYVYDQLIALLNSIEANLGSQVPVCVYPYDDRTERIAEEISRRPNVSLYADQRSIERWDKFARDVWDSHPTAHKKWKRSSQGEYHRFGTHRRLCAFDGPFDRFIYMDADTLLMGAVDHIFELISQKNWVVNDFQHKDLSHVYNSTTPKLKRLFTAERLQSEIFCSGFYGASKNLFDQEKRDWLLSCLRAGEAAILYDQAPDQTLLNYMVMRSELPVYNLTLRLPKGQVTGNSVTSLHFEEEDHILYDRGQRLTYLHYIGLSSKLFRKLCQGQVLEFPYRDVFLHYRYRHEPDNQPQLTIQPKPTLSKKQKTLPRLTKQVLRKLGLAH